MTRIPVTKCEMSFGIGVDNDCCGKSKDVPVSSKEILLANFECDILTGKETSTMSVDTETLVDVDAWSACTSILSVEI